MALICSIVCSGQAILSLTILEPALVEIHDLEPEVTTLFLLLGTVFFIFGLPIVVIARKKKLASRKTI